ncbi:uncharacterized protein LOC8269550 isoform X2 [Ricinus communis]|uniref:uncharacterized protein LOC8269550 isoform X2 n=1 Tax=Ricinus communis TaxID=3988 RepID=UPI0007729075|nr:uncharacterized protein LOC8269550 isoform X2 [Ricinus communis]|eukprot:XP_015578047.1 uncharacterized protein LOC8269550 isoform X1 [Ricinus communis]
MRFKKGSKVEVFSKIDVPSGSWRCAEIICGNGHTYTVRYEAHAGSISERTVERISRKAIRPCPPLPEIAENWAPGDVVEVFDDFSWKMATISKVLGKKYFLARIVGSSLEFKVSKSGIRTRQSWQDGKWIVIGKGSGSYEDTKHDENVTLKCKQNSQNNVQMRSTRLKVGSFRMRNKETLKGSNIVSCRTLKRGPCGYKQVETYDGAAQKFRAVEKEGRLHRVLAANQSSFAQQGDDVAFPKEMVGEKNMHSSFYSQTGFTEIDVERRKQSGAVGCSSAIEVDSNDEESITSSVGSCSTTSNNYYKMHHRAGFIEDIDGNFSDAESFCHRGYEEGTNCFPTNEELAAEVHRLELHAYRCTMEALYASGPFSWEQEEMVTNLRLSLHISNDEHLMEGQSRRLAHLTSSQC